VFSWVITESGKFGSILGWLMGSPAVLSERQLLKIAQHAQNCGRHKYSSWKVASQ
jgi:hypothetical protein